MLPKVSRTFAICIRLLPRRLEHPVLVAYLLCRIADTIEDATRLTSGAKDRLLNQFGRCLEPDGPSLGPLREAFVDPATDEERLAHEAERVVAEFGRLSSAHRQAIRPWVQEMSAGMAEFTRRREASLSDHLEALSTVGDLDRYCYYVAGTVGHLLTELFRLHAGSGARRHDRRAALATSFGLGLQLTNIIKDVADDRRRGWSFVPRELCQVVGIRPEDLQDPRHRGASQRVMVLLIEKAQGHLLDALEYTVLLERRQYGIRQFCLSALFFAVRTLRLARRDARLLDPHHKVKISRPEVYRTLAVTRAIAPSNLLIRAYFRRLAGAAWQRHGGPAPPRDR